MIHRNVLAGLTVAFAMFVLASAEARAQQAGSFEQLQVLVKPGDKIYVTDATGNVTKGKLVGLSTSTMRLLANGATREVTEADIFEIRQWRHDSLVNGAEIGAGIGLGTGVLAAVAWCRGYSGCGGGETVAGIAIYTGLGAAIGAGIDALIPSKVTIYKNGRRTSLSKIRLQPLLSRTHKGIQVSMSF